MPALGNLRAPPLVTLGAHLHRSRPVSQDGQEVLVDALVDAVVRSALQAVPTGRGALSGEDGSKNKAAAADGMAHAVAPAVTDGRTPFATQGPGSFDFLRAEKSSVLFFDPDSRAASARADAKGRDIAAT